MRFLFLLAFVVSCGTSKVEENPTTCAVKEVEEGVEFKCVDKDGKESVGTVKHGKNGAKGEVGETGPKGEQGEGLKLESSLVCKGVIEGWMPQSGYHVEYKKHSFETGAVFLSVRNVLKRGEEVVNVKSASAFYLAPEGLLLSDGVLSYEHAGKDLKVSSQGGMSATLPCEE